MSSEARSQLTQAIEEDEELSELSDVSETEEGESLQGEGNDREAEEYSGDDRDSAVQDIIEGAHSQASHPLFRAASEVTEKQDDRRGVKRKSSPRESIDTKRRPKLSTAFRDALAGHLKGPRPVLTASTTNASGIKSTTITPSAPELEQYFQSIRELHHTAKTEMSPQTKELVLKQARQITNLKTQLEAAQQQTRLERAKREQAEAVLEEMKKKIKSFVGGLPV